MENGIIISHVKFLELQEELEYLKTLKRLEYSDEIAEEDATGAIADEQVREDLQKIEERIRELENFFANVIDVD